MVQDGLTINTDFPDEVEDPVIRQASQRWGERWGRPVTDVYISRFPRFGKSGAKLLGICFDKTFSGVPYLLKIAKTESVKEEDKATRSLHGIMKDAEIEGNPVYLSSGWGGLLFPIQGTEQPDEFAKRPVTLSRVLYHPLDSDDGDLPEAFPKDVSLEALTRILDKVFSTKLGEAHKCQVAKVNVAEHYGKYLDRPHATTRLQAVFGSESSAPKVDLLGEEISNPLMLRQNLPSELPAHVGRVHGDLHPDNIVLDRDLRPYLIDFKWGAEPRDVLVDFVLLENSIRFWHFPFAVNLKERIRVDRQLLDEDGAEKVAHSTYSGPDAMRYYTRLATMLGVIREKAKSRLGGEFTMQKYLWTQFLVLYGLAAYEDYNPQMTAFTLGLIAGRLSESGLESIK